MIDKAFVRKANKIEVLLRNVDGTNDADFKRLINYLNQFNLLDLFDLLSQNKYLFEQLRQARYDAYWNGELRSLPVGSEEEPFTFRVPQHISSLEFMMGYVFAYQLDADTLLQDKPEFFLRLADEYHSFHALNMGVQRLLASLYKAPDSLDNEALVWQCITLMNRDVGYHVAPGYLLAAYFYFHLMCVARKKQIKVSDLEQQNEMAVLEDGYLVTAYHYVLLAELSEADSSNEMHNFFRELVRPEFNPFPVSSIKQIAPWFQKKFPNVLNTIQIKRLKEQAEIQLQQEYTRLQDHKIAFAAHNLNQSAENPAVCLHSPKKGLNCFQETELLIAARQGKLEVVEQLLKTCDKEAITAQDYHGNTVLHLAVLGEFYDLTLFLTRNYPELCAIQNKDGDKVTDLMDDVPLKLIFKLDTNQENRFQFFKLPTDLPKEGVSNENFLLIPYDKKK